jgi:hypothetical protein
MIKKLLGDMNRVERFSEGKFTEIFGEIDRNRSGTLNKKEVRLFLKKVL